MKRLSWLALALLVGCGDASVNNDGGSDGSDGGGTDADMPGGGDPLKSIDTGSDPQFPVGDIKLVINGASITVNAGRKVQTAAAVYKADGTMVRTLWRRRIIEAGASTSITWDFKDDLGADVPDAAYKVNVIAHNIAYKWQGVIGNTSNPGAAGIVSTDIGGGNHIDTVGPYVHRSFHPTTSMAIGPNGTAFLATGYNELQNAMGRFEIANPQKKTLVAKDDYRRTFEIVATDGNIAYFVNTGLYGGGAFNQPENFITGISVANNQEVTFANGSTWDDGDPNQLWRVIDPVIDGGDQIRGIAVETSGNNLYVAHKNTGIKILNKTSGQCTNGCNAVWAVPSPGGLALAPNCDLWVISNDNTEVRQYTNPGTTHTLGRTISGFGKATGIGISPLTSTLIVVDAGADQQLKAYNTATGDLVWKHGIQGGYSAANGPDVTPQKLNLRSSDSDVNYVAFEPSTTEEIFWVGEPGSFRNLKFKIPASPAAQNPLEYKDQIL